MKGPGEFILVHPDVFEDLRARRSPSLTISQQLRIFGSCILELPGQRFSCPSFPDELRPIGIEVDAKDVPAPVWSMMWAAGQWCPR